MDAAQKIIAVRCPLQEHAGVLLLAQEEASAAWPARVSELINELRPAYPKSAGDAPGFG